MNIYLDINGVLMQENTLAEFAEPFLAQVFTSWRFSTYWLSSYCWHGQNKATDIIRPLLKRKSSIQIIESIQPTQWDELKTDAIDFKTPFLWFDSSISADEKEILKYHRALDCFRQINLSSDPMQLFNEMIYLKTLA